MDPLGLKFVIVVAPVDAEWAARLEAWLDGLGCTSRHAAYHENEPVAQGERALVVVSESTPDSPAIWEQVVSRGIRLIPVLVGGQPPEYLRTIMPIDLRPFAGDLPGASRRFAADITALAVGRGAPTKRIPFPGQ